MRIPLLLYGMAASALIHGACIPLVMWVAEDEQALRLPGRRVAVHMTLDVRPGPPPAKLRGPLPRNGLNIKPGEKLTGAGKVARKVTAVPNPPPPTATPAPIAKPEPKPAAKTEPKAGPKPTPKPESKPEPKPEPKPAPKPELQRESTPKHKPTAKPALKTLQPVSKTVVLKKAAPKKTALKKVEPKPLSKPIAKAATAPPPQVKADSPPAVAVTPVAQSESKAAFQPEAKPEAAPPPPQPHAISLYPDAPTRRGRKGASDAQMLGTDETLPRFGQNRPPIYPPEAVQDRREGTVLLRLHVAVTGRVTDVEVARSSGYGVLDEAAVDAVRSWTGVPRSRYGRAIESVELLPVVFTLR